MFPSIDEEETDGLVIAVSVVLLPVLIVQCTMPGAVSIYENNEFGSFMDIVFNLLPCVPTGTIYAMAIPLPYGTKLSLSDLYLGTDGFDPRGTWYLTFYSIAMTVIAVIVHAIEDIRYSIKKRKINKMNARSAAYGERSDTMDIYNNSNNSLYYNPNIISLDNLVEFENVTFTYKSRTKCKCKSCRSKNKERPKREPILRNINVSINNVSAVVGKSGAGKSTFFNLILGILKPDKGRIRVLGKPPELARNYIGVVFQQSQLFPDLTVRQHVKLLGGLKVGKLSDADVLDILRQVLLDENCLNLKPRNMSGGMQRRLCIALAILGDIRFLLLDEPTTGLDPITQLEIWNLLHVLNQKIPIIFSTHMLSEIATLEADILFVGGQKVTGNGSLENILERGVCVEHSDMSVIRIDDENIFRREGEEKEKEKDPLGFMRKHSYGEIGTVRRLNKVAHGEGEIVSVSSFKVEGNSESESESGAGVGIEPVNSAGLGMLDTSIQDTRTKVLDGSTSMEDFEKIEIREFDKGCLVFSRYFPINIEAVSIDYSKIDKEVPQDIVIRQWSVEEAVTIFSGYEKITDIADNEEGGDTLSSYSKKKAKRRHRKENKKERKSRHSNEHKNHNSKLVSTNPATTTENENENEYTASDPLISITMSGSSEQMEELYNYEASTVMARTGNPSDNTEDIDADEFRTTDTRATMSKRRYKCTYCLSLTKFYLLSIAKAGKYSPFLVVFMLLAPALLIMVAVGLLGATTGDSLSVDPETLFSLSLKDNSDDITTTATLDNTIFYIGTETEDLFDLFCNSQSAFNELINNNTSVEVKCVLSQDLHTFKTYLYDEYKNYYDFTKNYNDYNTCDREEEEDEGTCVKSIPQPILGIYYKDYNYEKSSNSKDNDKMRIRVDFIPQIFQCDADAKYVMHTIWALQVFSVVLQKQHEINTLNASTHTGDTDTVNTVSFAMSVGNDKTLPMDDNMTMYCLVANIQLPVIVLWTISRKSKYHLLERLSGGYSKAVNDKKRGVYLLPVIIDMLVLFLFSFVISLTSFGAYAVGNIRSLKENSFSVLCLQSLSIALYISVVGTAFSFMVNTAIAGVITGLVFILIMLAIGNTHLPYGEYYSSAFGKFTLALFPDVLLAMSMSLTLGGGSPAVRFTAPRIALRDLTGYRDVGDNPNIEYVNGYNPNTDAYLSFFGCLLLNALVWINCIVLRRVPLKIIEHVRYKKRIRDMENSNIKQNDRPKAKTDNDIESTESELSNLIKHNNNNKEEQQQQQQEEETSDYILRSNNLTKKFGRRTVLHSINLTIKRGDRIAILGTTGSGKTTFLDCLTGEYASYHGSIQYNARSSQNLSGKIMTPVELMSVTSLCEQEDILFDYLTVFEHVLFALRLQYKLTAVRDTEKRKMAREILSAVGLTSKDYNKKPGELSGGMKRRLSIAIALSARRDITVLDEPTTGLDMATKLQVTQSLLEIHKTDPTQTLIMTTHDMDVAERFANRIIILDRGFIKLDDNVPHIRATAPTLIKASSERRYTRLIELLQANGIVYEEIMSGASRSVSISMQLSADFKRIVEGERGLTLMEPSIHTAFARAVQ